MGCKPHYPVLEAKIAECGIAKKDIAKELGIAQRTMSVKLKGKTSFSWEEVVKIHNAFFNKIDV